MRASRGKVLGGSSAVNAGVAIRPRPADFAKWGAHRAGGWSFADVLPTFKLMENNPGGEDAYHGRTGPLPVRQLTDEADAIAGGVHRRGPRAPGQAGARPQPRPPGPRAPPPR